MKRLIITASLLGGMLYKTKAQEFTIGVNAAQAGTRFGLPNGTIQLKPSFGGEFNFHVPIGKHMKVLTGAEIFQYQSRATLADNQVYRQNMVDDIGSAFEYRVLTSSYAETQRITALRLPLMLQYLTGSGSKTRWYFNAGVKYMLPGKISGKASAARLVTTGYYPDVNAELHDLPQHGFGTVNNWQGTGYYSTKPGWLLSAGTGVSFKLSASGKTRLYAGVYADYGISNMQNTRGPLPLVTYNAQNVALVQANTAMAMDNISNLHLLNLGIQLKLGFGHKTNARKPVVAPPPAPVVEPKTVEPEKKPVAPDTTEKTFTAAERYWIEEPVYFITKNNTQLSAESKQRLAVIASMLNKYPHRKLLIKGHTCDIGTPAINERRSLERAKALADYLVSQGVQPARIQIAAVGSGEPLVPNDSEENRQKNRRAVIKLVD